MAKNKKPASGSPKKTTTSINKKPAKKVTGKKIDNKKVVIISEKISKINKSFESLISECQIALKALTQNHGKIIS